MHLVFGVATLGLLQSYHMPNSTVKEYLKYNSPKSRIILPQIGSQLVKITSNGIRYMLMLVEISLKMSNDTYICAIWALRGCFGLLVGELCKQWTSSNMPGHSIFEYNCPSS